MKYLLSFVPFILCSSFGFGQNLISNSGFESNGQLNCMSWYDACDQELTYLCDTLQPGNPCDIMFYKDTPPEGGVWSLGATGIGNGFPATASTYITGQSGTHQYLLNVWMKNDGQAFGGANIGIRSNGINVVEKTIPANSPDWAFYSVRDTLKPEPADTIQITLSAFAAGPAFGNIYFDQVEFILLDTLTSGISFDPARTSQVAIYPNPAIQYINLNMLDQHQEHTISLYSMTGQLIQTQVTSDQLVTINLKGWESGLYFYRVESGSERRTIGAGKFVVE